ncbi:autoinducer binding domain-containing protein [Chromobacterium phragmitis]|uniref:autoinducer binding domain-containing protein n=1 Tax=Chromobacterium amazonense TaxID=1382803 RepID=UPI0021B79B64|nr:autoinducer binding domain-containing protein [Chromobacterium amazonense]MBM2883942.1 autoinducer binding domain-containing protein [Chromobacterium amazonense]MDE1711859.1 autoinducer binding domain-containing protein [Chromobacterium amazonense]
MLVPLPKLPDVEDLIAYVPGPTVGLIAVFRRQLLRIRTMTELEDAVALLMGIARGAPIMLVVMPHTGELSIEGKISFGWNEDWETRYRGRAYHEVDPIAHALPGELVSWSPLLVGKRSSSERLREFLADCEKSGMTHGVSYAADYKDCRIIISLIGREVEEDRLLHQALASLLPDTADVSYRIFARFREISELEKFDQNLISLICKHGLTNKEAAQTLSVHERTINNHLRSLRERYCAKTNEQLMFKLGAGEW